MSLFNKQKIYRKRKLSKMPLPTSAKFLPMIVVNILK